MLDTKKCCLVIVDVQGKLAELMDGKESVLANIEILIKAAKALGLGIIWCQQYPKALGQTVPQIAELLDDSDPIDKFSFSCCGQGEFNGKLKELRPSQIILCGIEAHVCIYQTAADLLDTDYEVHVIADAVSSRTPANREIAIRRMDADGVIISSTEMALFELLRTAKHEKFKELAKLIK
ncbi:MAG: hydrolase [Planctomycetota bacterium]|jgi:nicotinamidase-related amidase